MLNQLTTKAYINVSETIRNFMQDSKGVTAIEYGLIAVAVAVFITAVFGNDDGTFLSKLSAKFDTLVESISPKEE
ncbi:Flp family type IVb pilin [Caviibacterium pharyngocola]|uniref:Flp family type IVb pilin n=1 Tax=Caviibacterium pharyngocola TaxID=28159 RepID=A0A2M8RWV2_9PAST|nr:Flp family type IVb pilin [Caviibacterium pharyngocola]PJG83353.1 Flp family type IVb pilin [Caviibacterium pharyngocola]